MGTLASNGRVGWNWLWFGPVCLIILYFVELHTVHLAVLTVRLVARRWSWVGLLSPSTYCYFGTVLTSVSFPFRALWFAKASLSSNQITAKHRYILVGAAVVSVILLPLITDTLIWGSFPFQFDDSGVGRLRLIPFVPWPSGGYMTF